MRAGGGGAGTRLQAGRAAGAGVAGAGDMGMPAGHGSGGADLFPHVAAAGAAGVGGIASGGGCVPHPVAHGRPRPARLGMRGTFRLRRRRQAFREHSGAGSAGRSFPARGKSMSSRVRNGLISGLWGAFFRVLHPGMEGRRPRPGAATTKFGRCGSFRSVVHYRQRQNAASAAVPPGVQPGQERDLRPCWTRKPNNGR